MKSERKYRAIFELSPEAIVLLDTQGNIIDVNGRLHDWLGYKPEEVIGRNILELPFLPEASKLKALEKLSQRMGGEELSPYDLDFTTRSGERCVGRIVASPMRDESGVAMQDIVMISDITGQKRAEERLDYRIEFENLVTTISTEFINLALDNIDDGINQALQTIGESAGVDRSYVFQFSDNRARMHNTHEWCAEGIEPQIDNLRDLSVNAAPWWMERLNRLEDIHIPRVVDLPPAANSEREILQSQDIRSLAVVPMVCGGDLIGFVGFDSVRDEKVWSEDIIALLRIVGEMFANALERKRAEEELSRYRDHLEELVRERTEELRKTNEELQREIAERLEMEQELLKAQKLESIGILAGGIAHDFNNILTGILGNISLAGIYKDPEKIAERLAEAERSSLRAKVLIQKLLTFSRGGAPVRKTVAIAELLEDSANFALSGSDVRCEFSIPYDLWPVEIDEGQISQVINNLVINADQAMPEGGKIRISAENVTLEPDAFPVKEGRYVKISIQDQGVGIPEEHLQKIFDPYFSTKQKGSGLGLTTAYSIIKNHDGYIAAESAVGIGTTFDIYLPAPAYAGIPPRKLEKREKPIMGKGRILVIDDEEIIRELISDMLVKIGYEVTVAAEGAGAIEIYRRSKESGRPFDAVIVDLTIPGGMGGKEAIQKLLEIDPEVKAIVSSGYSRDPIMADFRKYGFKGVICKPYKIRELSEVLHRTITGTSFG